MDPKEDNCLSPSARKTGKAVKGRVPLGYFGDLETEYEKKKSGLYKAADTAAGECQHPCIHSRADARRQEGTMEKEMTASVIPCSARPLKLMTVFVCGL